MIWQKNAITTPLLPTSSKAQSVRTFKVIQHAMGDRDRPLPLSSSSSSLSAAVQIEEEDISPEREVVLEEIQWMLSIGIGEVEMRDEIFCQIIKQLSNNPNPFVFRLNRFFLLGRRILTDCTVL